MIMSEIKLQKHPDTNKLISEVWRDIEGYEGHYQISNYGRVKSLKRTIKIKTCNQHTEFTKNHTVKERILKGGQDRDGYILVVLAKSGNNVNGKVHRLVAEAFIPNPENKPCVNHIDGDKTNNHVDNLEWATISENMQHGYDTGLVDNGKKVAKYTMEGDLLDMYRSCGEAAKSVGCDSRSISMCCRKECKSAYGYQWIYCEETPPNKIPKYSNKMGGWVVINQLDENKNIIKTWDSVNKAAKHFNCSSSSISAALTKGIKIKGFYWERV